MGPSLKLTPLKGGASHLSQVKMLAKDASKQDFARETAKLTSVFCCLHRRKETSSSLEESCSQDVSSSSLKESCSQEEQ